MEVLETTMSRRQLHGAERRAGEGRQRHEPAKTREAAVERKREDAREATLRVVAADPPSCSLDRTARPCGMEAVDVPRLRAQAKLRKADGVWASLPAKATPDFQTRSLGSGDGRCGTLRLLTQRELHRSSEGSRGGRKDDPAMPVEQSDHLVVATKPAKAGGAKGVTG
jgi:hypothetical protein